MNNKIYLDSNKINGKRKKNYFCCGLGCGIPLLFAIAFVVLFLYAVNYTKLGENEDTSPIFYTEKGSNYSYFYSYMRWYCEFTISEEDFLDWCSNREFPFEVLEIKDLPSLPKHDRRLHELTDDELPMIHERRGGRIPLSIVRFSSRKPEHENCKSYWEHIPPEERCVIDPTGKTDNSCFRIVEDGYYHEHRWQCHGGLYILYDRTNNRCYIKWNRR